MKSGLVGNPFLSYRRKTDGSILEVNSLHTKLFSDKNEVARWVPTKERLVPNLFRNKRWVALFRDKLCSAEPLEEHTISSPFR